MSAPGFTSRPGARGFRRRVAVRGGRDAVVDAVVGSAQLVGGGDPGCEPSAWFVCFVWTWQRSGWAVGQCPAMGVSR